ncbi:hypothetical protein JTE90_026857 [Oedothorax gibbosus]|uniref:Uncharacterized protein n=1 Tax=Oedothorax gibbosus TaxID=931172 RepID=A0AAV6TZK2_9ARAC|nr:hypothetical protein JTE90_026857 [Oedothorax gibbosus]
MPNPQSSAKVLRHPWYKKACPHIPDGARRYRPSCRIPRTEKEREGPGVCVGPLFIRKEGHNQHGASSGCGDSWQRGPFFPLTILARVFTLGCALSWRLISLDGSHRFCFGIFSL